MIEWPSPVLEQERDDGVIGAAFVRNVGLKKHEDRAHLVKMEKTELTILCT